MASVPTDGKQIMDKVASYKNGGDITKDRNRATIAGGTVGGLFGIYYGYSKKKNVMICAVIGAGLGAILSRIMMPK